MKTSVHFSSASGEWTTPPELFERLNRLYSFTLDACATKENALCERYYDKEIDCLKQRPEGERIFINPPYGDPEYVCSPRCKKKICQKRGYHNSIYRPGGADFVEWAWKRGFHNVVIALLPARTDTRWFQRFCKDMHPDFLPGRLKFGGAQNSAPFPSMIVDFTRRS